MQGEIKSYVLKSEAKSHHSFESTGIFVRAFNNSNDLKREADTFQSVESTGIFIKHFNASVVFFTLTYNPHNA